MYTYADAITAFAFVQGIGFGFVIGQNDVLANNVHHYWFFAVPIMVVMNFLFFLLVRQCHLAEDRLIGTQVSHLSKTNTILSVVRKMRIMIICVVGIGEILLSIGEAFWPARWIWP
ncbi:MAG: hypothetical protein WAN35_12625 [Terracidiphilus sp.]